MEVKRATTDDIAQIVKVHLSAFPGFFLTELGESFLKLYYSSVLKSDGGILLVGMDDNEVVGFCGACKRSAGFHSSLLKENLLKFGAMGARLIFTKPKAILRLAKNLTKTGQVDDPGEYAELLSIGVRGDCQGKGVGKIMLKGLEKSLKDSGIKQLSLTTDSLENDKALQFYKGIGFSELYKFVTYPNRKMHRLIKNL